MTTQILLIDPDINFMVRLKTALEGTREFRVSVAANGWAADELLRHSSSDVAVIDFGIKDMDIMELVQRVRQIRPSLPVILTPSSSYHHERAQLMGAQAILGKPYGGRDLILMVQQVVQSPRTEITPPFTTDSIDLDDTFVGEASPFSTDGLDPDETFVLETPPASTAPGVTRRLDELQEYEGASPGVTRRLDELQEYEGTAPGVTRRLDDFDDQVDEDDLFSEQADARPEAHVDAPTQGLPTPAELLKQFERGTVDDVPDILETLEALERIQAGRLDEPSPTRALAEEAAETQRLRDTESLEEERGPLQPLEDILDELEDYAHDQPHLLDDRDEPVETHHFARDAEGTRILDDTGYAAETEPVEDRERTGVLRRLDLDAQADQLEPLPDEPPHKPDGTPSVRIHDLERIRQFLATDQGDQTPDDFGEALDAVSRVQPDAVEREPEDHAFHDLVDSMRGSGQDRQRRTRLEELLRSFGIETGDEPPSDTPSAVVDYVLDAIRRGKSPVSSDEQSFDLEDTTIGEVIEGLFDPSFEGVLAALAGEEIDDDTFEEPTYEVEGREARPAEKGADLPPDVPEESAGLHIEEPPISEEDSRRYPATTALTAITGEDDDDENLSLDMLLEQIEAQLPPARTHRPQLKPLPSWDQSKLITGEHEVEALFDHIEGIYREPAAPEIEEPDISKDDTIPSTALLKVMDSVQETDTQPFSAVMSGEGYDEGLYDDADVPEEFGTEDYAPEELVEADHAPEETGAAQFEAEDTAEALIEQDFAPEEAVDERFEEADALGDLFEEDYEPDRILDDGLLDTDELESFIDEFDTGMLSMEDLLAIADLPVEAGTEEIQREILQRAAAAARGGREPVEREPVEREPVDSEPLEEEPVVSEPVDSEPVDISSLIDEDALIPVPADTAAMLIETETAPADDIEDGDGESLLAAIAVQITQFSLESSAQATMITRPGARLAEAGNLPDEAMDRLFDLVDAAWRSSSTADALIRYITLPEAGEFLLYSTLVEHDLTLSMVFHAAIPVRTIRKQARRLSESLDLVPEPPEPAAARTLPSRPTDLKPPPGWEAALASEALGVDERIPVRPALEEDAPYTAYTCLWLPADPALELLDDLADGLFEWIQDIAADAAWDLDTLDILPDYVVVSLSAPQDTLPDEVILHLMDETTRLSAEYFPEANNGDPLWTDGYYVVSPPRALSEREIARFITYQRQAQLG